MKENKLARSLGITKEEALDIIRAYLETHPAIDGFYKDAIAETQETGFSFTLLGRRRFHPSIYSGNKMDRWSEERKCVNNQIQGTAADAVRLAMLKLSRANLEYKYGAKMLLQIHDELMFECPQETAEEAKKEIQDIMQHPFPTDLLVPLDVAIGSGPAWNKAK
jgi:DNA polymerase-1